MNEYQHHLRVLLEPYDAKVSRTVLRGESPSNGADLLDNAYRESLPQEQRAAFDKATENLSEGSVFEQMAENSSQVTLVATALFLGYLDKATAISESAGGGAAPKGGWGKKPDEDDMAFRQRCFLMGMHMLKSGKKRNVKR
ncbi:MAG: hypothetical protein PUG74_02370 [Prevotellaceae bacterium]|nr:hypothetical protein [Prevotellaceae bacterium]